MFNNVKKKFSIAVSVLLFVAVFTGTALAGDSVTVDGHTLDFIEVEYDTPAAGQSTWYYKVTSGTSPSLSHITFEIASCMEIVEAGTWDGMDTSTRDNAGATIEIGDDPTTGVNGVKFDDGFSDGEMRFYYFTVTGNHASGDITVGFKGGPTSGTDVITGPNVDCVPVDPTAISFNDFGAANNGGLNATALLFIIVVAAGTLIVIRRRKMEV